MSRCRSLGYPEISVNLLVYSARVGAPRLPDRRAGQSINLLVFAVPVVERPACQTQLQATRLGRSFRLHVGFMCAGQVQNTPKKVVI